MSIDAYHDALQNYVRDAARTASRKGKLESLKITWDGTFWARVDGLGWEAETASGLVEHRGPDQLNVGVEPTPALKKLAQADPAMEGFFLGRGTHALDGYHEEPPGEYGLWLAALLDAAIIQTEKELSRELRVKVRIEELGGGGPFAVGHYTEDVLQARTQSACTPTADFMAQVLKLFTADTKLAKDYIARASRIRAPKPKAWKTRDYARLRKGDHPDCRVLGFKTSRELYETSHWAGGSQNQQDWKFRNWRAAREAAEEILQERSRQGFHIDVDPVVRDWKLFRDLEKLYPVRATFSLYDRKREWNATETLGRWILSGDKAKVALAEGLIDPDGLSTFYNSAHTNISDPFDGPHEFNPVRLNKANAKLVQQLYAEVVAAKEPPAPMGPVTKGEIQRIHGAKSGAVKLSWRVTVMRKKK